MEKIFCEIKCILMKDFLTKGDKNGKEKRPAVY